MPNSPAHERVPLPLPRPWSEPITEEQFQAYAPEGMELIEGYLMGGPEDGEGRANLLALLLLRLCRDGASGVQSTLHLPPF